MLVIWQAGWQESGPVEEQMVEHLGEHLVERQRGREGPSQQEQGLQPLQSPERHVWA